MFCNKCGSELNEGDLFCSKCGAKINNDLKTEEYDPLVALDKGELVEDDVIWQEAPIDADTIIINKPLETAEPVMEEIDDSLQVVEKKETNFKESISTGLRAAKSTIAHPIKPRKRVKPTTPKPSVESQDVIIPETATQTIQETSVTEEIIPEVPPTVTEEVQPVVTEEVQPVVTEEVQPVVTETIEDSPIMTETVVEEIPTDSIVANDDVVDIFDDFVVDDSFGVVEEAPVVEEPQVVEEAQVVEQPPVVEEVPAQEVVPQEITPEEALFEEVPEPEPVVATPIVEETPVVETPAVEETPVVETPPVETPVEETPTTEEDVEEIPPLVEKQLKQEVPEPIIPSIEKAETTTQENIQEPETEIKKIIPETVAKTSAVKKAEQLDLEELVNEDNDTPILNSISEARSNKKVIKKIRDVEEVKEVDDVDDEIRSKFNTKLDDELVDESFDVDENINSLTSRITSILIIVLILIIAVVIATFLVQNIGL